MRSLTVAVSAVLVAGAAAASAMSAPEAVTGSVTRFAPVAPVRTDVPAAAAAAAPVTGVRTATAGAPPVAASAVGGQAKEGEDDGAPANRLDPSDKVPQPTLEGPVSGGIRTGEPYATTLIDLRAGWVEEEYFFGGTARNEEEVAAGTAGSTAFKSRILVRRPTDPAEFNGTVVLDWNNVTIPADRDVSWHPMHRTFMERGYVYVAVAAQRLGVEISPLALKQWDPVRYGSLKHPGDDYSFDIFSQAAEAVLSESPRVLGDLRPFVERRLALGASQSGGRLKTYINDIHEHSLVFDGFQPQISGAGGVRTDLVPIVWVNSGNEAEDADESPADGGLFRLWEIAGTAHTSYGSTAYTNDGIVYAHSNGTSGKDSYDYEDGGAWGYQRAPGECLRDNYYVAGHNWSAALVALDTWVRTGKAPKSMPRLARDASGRLYDEYGNMRGGVRTPLLDVPIATYFGGDAPGTPPASDPCGDVGGRMALSGHTRIFSAATLDSLYPTADVFLERFKRATRESLKKGYILPEGAADLLDRATRATAILDRADTTPAIPGGR